MANLYNLKAAYADVVDLWGVEPDPKSFDDVALAGWEQIGNRHTRLYKYIADTENKELKLPCNVTNIESVHIPLVDANRINNKVDFVDQESILVESYIDAWQQSTNPLNSKGKLVDYQEGDNTLYFSRDYKDVKVVYKGVLVDEEDGLPLINNREMKAIAAFVAWRELFKDGIKKRNADSIKLAQMVERE